MQATARYNYYELLELTSAAPQHEVSAAYERARNTYSGDNPAIYTIFSEQEARELLVMIEEAYQVLGNKILRNIYDQRLLSGRASLNDLTYHSIVEASKQVYPDSKTEKKEAAYKKDPAFEKEIQAQDNWTGDYLKKVREYKQISVERMSEITKINSWYVTAIEKVEPGNLPAVVFVRGYVVQIARALGLDDKKVADSYMKIFKASLGK
ncbi:helix-turn-helix domain-containing protein [Bdellovibrio svalbardensis]|uniref:Helix-turn-helix domain-containing protein n=1 Tax=Bdellovibrio svalbardensis TaxID=2972972 RepID=A0ABT6DE16_9BACT|nr:helix-turn-helix domain-containing protein [Bdellovibrio svalbardensis]MDG0815038.1 helix-turn-helix domain-containing protein [Bdellovibrio svalbardensis]